MKRQMFVFMLCALVLAGCPDGGIQSNRAKPAITEDTKDPQILTLRKSEQEVAKRAEESADIIEVQHILISFKDANPSVTATRSREEAEKLTAGLLAKINAGTDFTGLMKENSDDPGPGVYGMSKEKTKQDANNNIMWRGDMVPAFGNVGWRLKVGEVGVAPYHENDSPFGWHIIKRLK